MKYKLFLFFLCLASGCGSIALANQVNNVNQSFTYKVK